MSEPSRTAAAANGISIEIDHELCAGNGSCARSLPKVFEVTGEAGTETGKARIRDGIDWGSVEPAEVALAAQACPWSAIDTEAD